MEIRVTSSITFDDSEIEMQAIRAQGSGGQNVNKVASAIHLRFDINASSLPDMYKIKLLALRDKRISKEGVLVIKAQKFRTQEKNRDDAIQRLIDLIKSVTILEKKRVPTKPTKGSKTRRLEGKSRRSQIKTLRGKVDY